MYATASKYMYMYATASESIYATASKYIYATARLLAWGRATRLRQNECCHLACEDPVPCDASANASLVPTHPALQELVNLAYHLVPAPTTSRIGRSNDSGIFPIVHFSPKMGVYGIIIPSNSAQHYTLPSILTPHLHSARSYNPLPFSVSY